MFEISNKYLLKVLKQKLDKGAGRNCKEFSHFCFTCSCWDAYDTIKEFLDYSPETDLPKPKKRLINKKRFTKLAKKVAKSWREETTCSYCGRRPGCLESWTKICPECKKT